MDIDWFAAVKAGAAEAAAENAKADLRTSQFARPGEYVPACQADPAPAKVGMGLEQFLEHAARIAG